VKYLVFHVSAFRLEIAYFWLNFVDFCRRAEEHKKKERKEEIHPNSGTLAIRPDHLRRRVKMKLCTVGRLQRVVIHVKCDPNRLRGYGAVGVENDPFLLLWPVAYTTAGTTVQAVKTAHILSTFV